MGDHRHSRLADAALRCQPDTRLVALVRGGYPRAFDEIARRYGASLTSFAGSIVPAHRADDVVQDAMVKAYRSLPKADESLNLRAWLFTIVRNTALNDLRDEHGHEHLDENWDGVLQPPEIVAQKAELSALVAGIQGLPTAQREALLKRELEGRSHEEIASMLATTPGAVRALIFRARTALRDGAGLLIPMPALRALLEAGPMQVESAGAGVGGAAAGLTAGGGGGVAIKAGAALLVAGLAVGPGIALHDHGHGRDTASAAVARHDHAGGVDGRSGPQTRSVDGSKEASSADGRNSGHGPGSSDASNRGPGGQHGGSSRGPGPSGEGDGTGHRAGEGHESEPATESEGEGSGHDGGDRGADSPDHGGSGTSGRGGSGTSGSGSGTSGSGSGTSGSGSGTSGSNSSGSGSGTSGSGHGSSDSGPEAASSDAEA